MSTGRTVVEPAKGCFGLGAGATGEAVELCELSVVFPVTGLIRDSSELTARDIVAGFGVGLRDRVNLTGGVMGLAVVF